MNESEARASITIEEGAPNMDRFGPGAKLLNYVWEVWLPTGWRFSQHDTHVLCCASEKEAKDIKDTEEIERCPTDCDCQDGE